YRMQQQAGEGSPQDMQLDMVLAEADTLLARFRGLLRISALEDRQRRSGFVQVDPVALLQELHEFYLPLAEDDDLVFQLHLPAAWPPLHGDRALL
ncbi:two-component sensor histidine kinase, partial [Pseudomonas fluorescens]